MKALLVTILLAASVCLFARCSATKPPPVTPGPEASFVFKGTVADAASSTIDQLPADDQTYTVLVEDVYFQQGTFEDQVGRHVTVLAPNDQLRPGQQYVIYAEPFMFGSSIAVELIRANDDNRPGPVISEEMRNAHERRTLGERVREAEVIVTGSVVRIDSIRQGPRFESEHNPDLQQAFVRVDRVLKGDLTVEEAAFLFAASRDVQWYRAPKFNRGDEGIFLLNMGSEIAATLEIDDQQFTLFHPLDFQPPDKLQLIEDLL